MATVYEVVFILSNLIYKIVTFIFENSHNKEFELSEETVINCSFSIDGISLSNIDKEKILKFLKAYNIPVCYFDVASKKYLNGELDDYIGKSKMKKSNDLN